MRYSAYGYGADSARPANVKAENPLPLSDKRLETGNAAADGYTVLAQADRMTGERPPTEGYPDAMDGFMSEMDD